MSGPRSRSGSAANKPAELLSPSPAGEPRHSTNSTQGSLSIASYYYNNTSVESYDFTTDPNLQPHSPSWPPNLDSISGSPRGRALNEIVGGTSVVHKRTSGSIQRNQPQQEEPHSSVPSDFSGWASGLQYGNDRSEGSSDYPMPTSASLDPFAFSEDTPPQITLSHFSDNREIDHKIMEANQHSRDISSVTEGDTGRYQYGNMAPAIQSSASLQMAFSTMQDVAESLPGTPVGTSLHLMDLPLTGGVDESEGAFLTSNQATGSGWDRYGLNAQMMDSPEENDSEQERGPSYFGNSTNGQGVPSGSSPLRSVIGLEDGIVDDEIHNRSVHGSSADRYAHLGVSDGSSLARKGLDRINKSMRRISRRVVNLDGQNRERAGVAHIRLPDIDDEDSEGEEVITIMTNKEPTAPITPYGLRGKSLGLFGPDHPVRKAFAWLMSQVWMEPLILMLIIFNVVLVIIQSAPSVFTHPRRPGFLQGWVDYALLAVFGVFTVEVLGRIVVSGLFINPPALYEPPTQGQFDGEDGADEAESDLASLPSLGHQRRKASRSNTLDTMAVLSENLRGRATDALRPNAAHKRAQHISPNRAHPPKTVASDFLNPEGSSSDQKGKLKSVSTHLLSNTPFVKAIVEQRSQAANYAYLRHSWNRIDFVAVVSFWIMFLLSIFKEEMTPAHHIYIFRAMSVLRAARLLTITSGTSTILHSLKTAGPLLVNVAFFTLFSMLLFSIIGIQAFKGSYRRECVWIGDLNPEVQGMAGQNISLGQMCGGFVNTMGQTVGAVNEMGFQIMSESAKGFICPFGQICLEADENPYNNTESFDNIFHSLLQVIIVISLNGWSTVMYNMIDADYFSSFLFFVSGVLIMNFWLANLFVAVVINTFACITAETKQSAFTARKIDLPDAASGHTVVASTAKQRRQRVANVYKKFWGYTKFFWLALVVADLGVQASQASHQANVDNLRLSQTELYITIAFDVEILLRFFSYLLDNDWRTFFDKKRNLFDLFLAITTSIMQIPTIQKSPVYAWMTVFQLARFYRVIVAVPRMEALLSRVFGSLAGLMNMILFLLLIVGLATLIAVQLFRGDIPEENSGETNEINFKQIYNSYLGMYQLFSSENWTTVLYSVLQNEGQYRQAVIGAIFLCGWFLFANFIVLQMFIAVITENFGILESQKRAQQLEKYLRKLEKPEPSFPVRLLSRLSPYRWLRERNQAIMEGSVGKNEKPNIAQRAVDALDEKNKKRRSLHHLVRAKKAQTGLDVVRKILRLDRPEEQVPLDTLHARQFRQSFSGPNVLSSHINSVHDPDSPDATARLFARDRQLSRMRSTLGLSSDDAPLQSVVDAEHANRYVNDPRIAQARMINTHPSYEKSLWIFSNTSTFRRTCQSFVPPSYGERLFGRQTSRIRKIVYQAMIFGAIAASVVVAGVATPSYRRTWYGQHGFRRDSWFSLTEVSLSVFFLIEFLVKVIADGFAFTPNAYLMSPWNALDLFVLSTLVVNVSTELAVIGGVSRFTRALKALRALRLINLSDLLRRAFSALIAGAGRFLDVSVLAILYIVPFAVWGQNLFSGLLYSCTDTSGAVSTKVDCVGEYGASPSQWTFLAPRVWANPTVGSVYSFDDFKSSLLILFEIVSLEGWINVMTTAMSVTGRNNQLQTDSRQINALFFVIYNLIGAIFVLTLFVAVIIENFQEFSGAAYLTTAQRQWIDLKRLIGRQRPSKRPKVRPADPLRSWCYNRAVQKTGWWCRLMTFLYIGSLVTLATQRYTDPPNIERIRDIVYVCITFVFALDIIFRLAGLGWIAYRSDWWNLFDLFVVTGTLATTIPLLNPNGPINNVDIQLQKIFLTAVAFKLVQRSNALNQLFKTAISSLPSIASLFLLWLVMFLVWGIMLVEVFGLTAWGPNETYSKNFRNLGGALVFLSLMSTGEGWNQYMHDFTLSPPLCTPSISYLNTDCGSETWAYLLFISWNVMSMYIFLNMFTGTVVENFSYVFQMGGKPKLSREQVRNFKQAWSLHDKNRSGYLPKKELVGFFNALGGSMELKVHPGDASVKSLKSRLMVMPMNTSSSRATSQASPTKGKFTRNKGVKESEKDHFMWPPSPLGSPTQVIVEGLNISQLNQQLASLDYVDIQRRKRRFEHIYYEASFIADKSINATKGGISFHDMLILVAHYKLINDDEALCLEELVERREMQEKVEDRIQTERVRGMLRLVWLRRRFLALRAEKLRISAEWQQNQHHQNNQGVPTINIEDSEVASGSQFSREVFASSSRSKPKLTLNLDGVGPSVTIDSEPMTPPYRNSGQFSASQSTQHLSPHRPIRTLSPSSAGGNSSDGDGDDRIRLAQPDDGGISPDGSVSPSPSLREIERRASNTIESIDASAWGAIARRLSTEVNSNSNHQQQQSDTLRGDYGRLQNPRQNSQSTFGGASINSEWL